MHFCFFDRSARAKQAAPRPPLSCASFSCRERLGGVARRRRRRRRPGLRSRSRGAADGVTNNPDAERLAARHTNNAYPQRNNAPGVPLSDGSGVLLQPIRRWCRPIANRLVRRRCLAPSRHLLEGRGGIGQNSTRATGAGALRCAVRAPFGALLSTLLHVRPVLLRPCNRKFYVYCVPALYFGVSVHMERV